MNDIYDEFYKLFEEGNFHCGSRVTERIRVRQYKLPTMHMKTEKQKTNTST